MIEVKKGNISYTRIVERQKLFFLSGTTREIDFRLNLCDFGTPQIGRIWIATPPVRFLAFAVGRHGKGFEKVKKSDIFTNFALSFDSRCQKC